VGQLAVALIAVALVLIDVRHSLDIRRMLSRVSLSYKIKASPTRRFVYVLPCTGNMRSFLAGRSK
jgi:hypothetical protein